jgi:hypothetical protein
MKNDKDDTKIPEEYEETIQQNSLEGADGPIDESKQPECVGCLINENK